MASKRNLSVVIDIGTSKITALAGEKNEMGKVEVLAAAKNPSSGIKRGVVYNIDEAAECIGQAIEALEEQLEERIVSASVAYAGHLMQTIDYQNSKYTSEEGVVTKFDIDHLYNEVQKVELEQNYRIIQVIPTSFVIDNEPTGLNPVGITGREIVANYKLVAVPETYVTNLRRVFDKAGIEMGDIVHSSLALAEAVITDEEKEMGTVVLDMGAGTTCMSVFHDNMLMHTAVIPFGGNVVTKDIKEGCAILLKWAEQLKVKYGGALGDFADDQKVVTIPVHSKLEPKEISFKSLAYIIQARLEEIIDSVSTEIEKSGIADQLGAGIVVSGGSSGLENFISLVKFRTGMDARVATLAFNPRSDKKWTRDKDNLTAMGLLNIELNRSEIPVKETRKRARRKKEGGGISPWLTKVVQGVLDYVDDENDDIALN